MDKAGVTGLPSGEAAGAFPEVAFSGPNAPTNWRGTNARAFTEATNDYTTQDNIQWVHGKHLVTVGFQASILEANELTDAYGSLATWNFSNNQTAGFGPTGTLLTTTGNSFASYLLGALNSSTLTEDSVVGTGGRYYDYSWWAGDTFKATPRLTVNVGLRHDIWSPYREVLNRESFFNPTAPNAAAGGAPGILQFYGNGPDSCHCSTNVAMHWSNLGPRIGMAYALGNSSRTVIRAGYSVMYTHRGAVGGRVGGRTGTGTVGFSATPSFTNPAGNNYAPAFFWDDGIPAYQHPPFFDPTYGTEFNGISKVGVTTQYGDPALGGQPPRYQNWNFAIDHALTSTLTMGVAYIGSNGHYLGGGGRGFWSDQNDPRYLALGNLLTAQATPANIAAANAIIPGVRLPFAGYTGSIAQMLRPFPQYPGVSDLWGRCRQLPLQFRAVHRRAARVARTDFQLQLHLREWVDDTAGTRSAYNWTTERARTQFPAHIVNLLLVYDLPFGKGRSFGNQNRLVSAVAGGWQFSSIATFRGGNPIGTITGACNLPSAGSCYADYAPGFAGLARINGAYGSGNLIGSNTVTYLDAGAFASPAAYTYGNTPRTDVLGISMPSGYNEDVSLKRVFPIRERLKFAFQVDAINVFNFVNFSAPNTSITSNAFGKITSQANTPRVLQLPARISF